jgi:hypothetical protein
MAQPIVEIHIPLVSTGLPAGTTWPRSTDLIPDDYPFPWIGEVEEYLGEREEDGTFEIHDDGEELDDDYLYFITGGQRRDPPRRGRRRGRTARYSTRCFRHCHR